MIYRAPELNGRELEVIAAANRIHESIADHVLAPSSWSGSTSRGVHRAARLAGNAGAGYCEPPRETGFRRAMSYVLVRAQDANFKYSDELLCCLHFMLTEYDAAATPGRWRMRGGGVLDYRHNLIYRAPGADRIGELMGELLESLNDDDGAPAMVRAAMAHLNLVGIHPFRDGNGRLARCLEALMMARAGYTAPVLLNAEEYAGIRRIEYEAALQATHQGGSWEAARETRTWIRFCLTMRYRQALRLLRDFRNFAQLYAELVNRLPDHGKYHGARMAAGEILQATPQPWPGSSFIDQRAGLDSSFRFHDGAGIDAVRSLAELVTTGLLEPSRIEAGLEAPAPFA